MKVLPRDRRAAMYAIYAFCRLVDDVADEPAPIAEKLAGLAAWRARIAGALRRATPTTPVTRVLLAAVPRYDAAPGGLPGRDRRHGRWTPSSRSSRRTWPRSTSTATGSPPRSAGSRCAPSATPRRTPTRSPGISAARCSSPTSCATWPRTRAAAGSICRANGWTRPACRPTRRRRCTTRRCRPCAPGWRPQAHRHFSAGRGRDGRAATRAPCARPG